MVGKKREKVREHDLNRSKANITTKGCMSAGSQLLSEEIKTGRNESEKKIKKKESQGRQGKRSKIKQN